MNISLISKEEIDEKINTSLKDSFQNLTAYVFQGNKSNKCNFMRLIVFYDLKMFRKSGFPISNIDRLVNGYYWYTAYINGLKSQNINTEDHENVRAKIIESIGNDSGYFDWSILEKIDNELKI